VTLLPLFIEAVCRALDGLEAGRFLTTLRGVLEGEAAG
jgi:pyruvate/2-oxoglutarate dehydrogenase complex dihydrolipoamide acyltransferase (E2) component